MPRLYRYRDALSVNGRYSDNTPKQVLAHTEHGVEKQMRRLRRGWPRGEGGTTEVCAHLVRKVLEVLKPCDGNGG